MAATATPRELSVDDAGVDGVGRKRTISTDPVSDDESANMFWTAEDFIAKTSHGELGGGWMRDETGEEHKGTEAEAGAAEKALGRGFTASRFCMSTTTLSCRLAKVLRSSRSFSAASSV